MRFFLYAPAELPPSKLGLPRPERARLDGYDLVYDAVSRKWKGRVASLRPSPGSSVHGLLYTLDSKQAKAVVAWRKSDARREVEVSVDGGQVRAVVFSTPDERKSLDGAVSETFLAALVRGAANAGLPADYVQRLEAEAAIVQRVQAYGRERALS